MMVLIGSFVIDTYVAATLKIASDFLKIVYVNVYDYFQREKNQNECCTLIKATSNLFP